MTSKEVYSQINFKSYQTLNYIKKLQLQKTNLKIFQQFRIATKKKIERDEKMYLDPFGYPMCFKQGTIGPLYSRSFHLPFGLFTE